MIEFFFLRSFEFKILLKYRMNLSRNSQLLTRTTVFIEI